MLFKMTLSFFMFVVVGASQSLWAQETSVRVVSRCSVRFGPLELKKDSSSYFVELEGKSYPVTLKTYTIAEKYELLDYGYLGLDRKRLNRAEDHITLVKYLLGDEQGRVPLSFDLKQARTAEVFSFNTPTYYTSNTYDIVLLYDSQEKKLGGLSAPFDIGECH